MIEFTIETHIARPVDEVFAHSTDPDKLDTWQTNTGSAVQQDDGPMGVGTRIEEVHRGPGGRELHSVVEVSEYERERAFALRVVAGSVPVHVGMTFEPADGGTLMMFAAHGQPTGALRLLQPLLRRTLKRQFAADCERLKGVLEGASPAPGDG